MSAASSPVPLRVGFDGHSFDSPAGGIRRYVQELVGALRKLDPAHELVAIGARDPASVPDGVRQSPATSVLPTNLGWCLEGLPRGARRAHVDVFHSPAYTAPLWGVHPLVLTIHDVSYQRHPEWYPYHGDPVRRAFYRRSAFAADVVITDSEFSKREIVSAYGLPADRIRVIPLGVGAPFAPAPDRAIHAQRADGPLIAHVGDLHARRNVTVLLEALAALRARGDALANTQLILLGTDCGTGDPIAARAKELGVAAAVRFVAGADDDAVVSLMRTADVFAYPSLYEGFGLPVLEAMACGAPVVASEAASIPEVVGNAGLLADPHDSRAWYDALAAVLTSPERAAAMRSAGLARAAELPWSGTARKTLDVYQNLAARRTSL